MIWVILQIWLILLKYDTVSRKWNHDIKVEGDSIVIDGKKVKVLAQRDPRCCLGKIWVWMWSWNPPDFLLVMKKQKCILDAGAKKVVISAPAKGDGTFPGETILLGVNEEKFGTCDITSNASCTTNAAIPLIAILDEALGN